MKYIIFIILSIVTSISNAQNIIAPEGGGEYIVPQNDDNCLNDIDRSNIQNRLAINQTHLQRKGLLNPPSNREDIQFAWPLQAAETHAWNNYYGISNYIDQDSTVGIKDFNCGSRTYDGHKGIDIFSWPFPWYQYENNSIEIIAAADGVIIEKDDGFEDDHCECIGSWNAVYVQHTDGSVAWYGHMKIGSLTEKAIGESVEQGEYLGIVASSGCSTGPHLHLEVYDSEIKLIEPFTGECNRFNEDTWWEDQQDYREPKLNLLHTHDAVPEHGCPTVNEDPHFQNEFYPGDRIYTAFYYKDALAGSISSYRILTPDGEVWSEWEQEMETTFNASWWYWSEILPDDAPFGIWTLEATYSGEVLTHEYSYGVYANVENNDIQIKIYPNPAKNLLNITGINNTFKIIIIDLSGKTVFTENSKNNKVDITSIAAGLYTIQIQTEDKLYVEKFIKN